MVMDSVELIKKYQEKFPDQKLTLDTIAIVIKKLIYLVNRYKIKPINNMKELIRKTLLDLISAEYIQSIVTLTEANEMRNIIEMTFDEMYEDLTFCCDCFNNFFI